MQEIVQRVVEGLRPGWVRPSLRMRGRAVAAGSDVQAVLHLAAEGRGGRLRDAVVEVVQVTDRPEPVEEVVLSGRLGQDFVVRPGVEVAFPFSLELPGRLPPSGVGARYRIRVVGRSGLRRVLVEDLLVVLPREERGTPFAATG